MPEIRLSLGEIPDGGGMAVPVRDHFRIAVFRVGDRVAAIADNCPHAGGSFGEGPFDGTIACCPLHFYPVDVWQGLGHAGKKIATYPVAVEGDEVKIMVPDA